MNGFLVDTNVVSEMARPRPEPRVISWLYSAPRSTVFISVLTLGEIEKGLQKLSSGEKRTRLTEWATGELPAWFSGRVLVVDTAIDRLWGHFTGNAAAHGRSIPVIDGLLAATAIQHGLTLVTRNTSDVSMTGVQLLNPWLPE